MVNFIRTLIAPGGESITQSLRNNLGSFALYGVNLLLVAGLFMGFGNTIADWMFYGMVAVGAIAALILPVFLILESKANNYLATGDASFDCRQIPADAVSVTGKHLLVNALNFGAVGLTLPFYHITLTITDPSVAILLLFAEAASLLFGVITISHRVKDSLRAWAWIKVARKIAAREKSTVKFIYDSFASLVGPTEPNQGNITVEHLTALQSVEWMVGQVVQQMKENAMGDTKITFRLSRTSGDAPEVSEK